MLVKHKFLDKDDFTWATVLQWVECSALSSMQYLMAFSTHSALVDGLFIWLALVVLKTHCNFVHKDAIWTSCANEIANLMDATIVYTDKGFLSCTSQSGSVDKAD